MVNRQSRALLSQWYNWIEANSGWTAGYARELVHLVYLVYLVFLVCLVGRTRKLDPHTRVLGDNQDQEQIAVILFLTVIESISIAARLIPIASTTRSSTLDSLP